MAQNGYIFNCMGLGCEREINYKEDFLQTFIQVKFQPRRGVLICNFRVLIVFASYYQWNEKMNLIQYYRVGVMIRLVPLRSAHMSMGTTPFCESEACLVMQFGIVCNYIDNIFFYIYLFLF